MHAFQRVHHTLADQRGFTLAEVSIAALVLAIGAVGVLGVVLQCRYTAKNTQSREEMQFYARKLQEDLKGYVSFDTAGNANRAPYGRWDYCWCPPAEGTCCEGGLGGALSAGLHDVSAMLPPHLRSPPVSATLTYTVTANPNGASFPPMVSVAMGWQQVE